MLNDYTELSETYRQTATKPDKQFSTLPTVLKIAGDVEGKTILDLGCGGGFFSNAFARKGAKKVFGIDNAAEQISLAKKSALENTAYIVADIFEDALPTADIVLAPYVVNYATDTKELAKLFQNIYASLKKNGKLVMVVDLPEGRDLKKFGAVKSVLGEKVDGARIEIQLFNKDKFICTLSAVYFTPSTLEKVLYDVGFADVVWSEPIIANEGIKRFGDEFWEGYLESPELGYISAVKM